MKTTYYTAILGLLVAFCPIAATGQEFEPTETSQNATKKPIIAVPTFSNRTRSQTTRVAPGKYKSYAKHEATVRLDVDANAENSRYIKEMDIEYADGEWMLPNDACEIATDAATSAVVATRRFRVLSRSNPALEQVDMEDVYQVTSGNLEAFQAITNLRNCNAKYMLLGRINRFRIDRTEGTAYGVLRRLVVTTVSVDMQLIDIESMEIIAGESVQEKVATRIPAGITKFTSIYDWEPVLRKAVAQCVPKFLNKFNVSSAAPDEVETAAPMVEVNINSVPDGADVEFNGNFVGNTPCTVSLPSIMGVMSISAPGYQIWKKRIRPSNNMKITPRLNKEKAPTAPLTPPTSDIIIVD